jgi:hypothetical protein
MRHKIGPDLIVDRESLEKSTTYLLQETLREAHLECVTSMAFLYSMTNHCLNIVI